MNAQSLHVLVAHNAYQMRGGEDAVVEAEIALLRSHGHAVTEYRRQNDELKDMRGVEAAIDTLWSRKTSRDLDQLIVAERPDVIHAHNTFPLISPSLYWAAHRHGIPVVQTLHNFRLLCPQAMFLREGKVCEDCLGKVPWRATVHSCYRGSAIQSSILTGMLMFHRSIGTWQAKVSRYIALNEFCRDKFILGGLPANRIVVKPNFSERQTLPESVRSAFVYVGRLSPEKGIAVLADAAKAIRNTKINVLGRGPSESDLLAIPGIELLGQKSPAQVASSLREAIALVFPSICLETFGLVIIEAFANATPVIASRIGVVPELVEEGVTGLLFKPGDANELAIKIRWARENPESMAKMGRAARARFEEKFTPEKNYVQLVSIYRDVIAKRTAST